MTLKCLTLSFMRSKFKEIYDENFFISTLENDVRVVDKIPGYLMERFDRNMTNVLNFKVKAWAPIHYYKDTVLPRLLEEKYVNIYFTFFPPQSLFHSSFLHAFNFLINRK